MCHVCNNIEKREEILEYYLSFIKNGYITEKDYIQMYIEGINHYKIKDVSTGDFVMVLSTDIKPEELFPNLTKERLEKLMVLK